MRSANPAASGSSGPMTTSPISFCLTNRSIFSTKFITSTETLSANCAVPGFPGHCVQGRHARTIAPISKPGRARVRHFAINSTFMPLTLPFKAFLVSGATVRMRRRSCKLQTGRRRFRLRSFQFEICNLQFAIPTLSASPRDAGSYRIASGERARIQPNKLPCSVGRQSPRNPNHGHAGGGWVPPSTQKI